MILVFDLDDTLYREITYVKSGFKAVAEYLFSYLGIPKNESLSFMLNHLKSRGRNKIFDATLKHWGIYTINNVKQCVSVYHTHKPHIHLDAAALRCLRRFKHIPKYVITDGNKVVQANKVKALGLEKYIRFSFITHRYGIKHAKPSPYCFEKICKRERVKSSEVVFIGDNPSKDFIKLKPLGFLTIRLLQGSHKTVKLTKKYEANIQIKSLDQLTTELLREELCITSA